MTAARLGHAPSALYRAADWIVKSHVAAPPRSRARAVAFFHASRQRQQETKAARYGTANELPPHLQPRPANGPAAPGGKPEGDINTSNATTAKFSAGEPATKLLPPPSSPTTKSAVLNANNDEVKPENKSPLDRVTDFTSPSQPEEEKFPHLQAPQYVHHFDTFSLVRDLQKGGFTENQTIDIMKAIRALLAENMSLARRALVSKSNVENELYLFRAACSELKTEIQNNRKTESEKGRSQRAQLQHEVDTITQRMTQDITSLKEELRGIFDDRKMDVRMQQKKLDVHIQEINSKIAVALNSESRSTIEGMRWILTRRAAMALGAAVLMVGSTFYYGKLAATAQAAERKKRETDVAKEHQITSLVEKGSTQGLAEEVLLGSEGASGG